MGERGSDLIELKWPLGFGFLLLQLPAFGGGAYKYGTTIPFFLTFWELHVLCSVLPFFFLPSLSLSETPFPSPPYTLILLSFFFSVIVLDCLEYRY